MSHEFRVSQSPWGPDDEIGALNNITPQSRVEVLSRVDGSRVYDRIPVAMILNPARSNARDAAGSCVSTSEQPRPSSIIRGGPAETRPQAAKMPMLAVTPTEVFDAMHHCIPNEAYP